MQGHDLTREELEDTYVGSIYGVERGYDIFWMEDDLALIVPMDTPDKKFVEFSSKVQTGFDDGRDVVEQAEEVIIQIESAEGLDEEEYE